MYVPPIYAAASAQQIHALIRAHPLALLVSNGPDVPYATHLPVVPAPQDDTVNGHAAADGDPCRELAGQRLLGHLNRENPHWAALADGASAKLVFAGPGGYVTPALYDPGPAAPTWDFATVHLEGTLRLITAEPDKLKVVRRTAALLEAAFGDGWSQHGSQDYFRSIVGGVGAFEFTVTAADAMFKLSQEKPAAIQRRIADRFAAAPGTTGTQLKDLMCEFGLGVGQ